MNFLEKNLEEIIYENSTNIEDRLNLQQRGLAIFDFGYMFRQASLGNYGIADLIDIRFGMKDVCGRRKIHANVFELKKDHLDWGVFHQAARYKRGIQSLINAEFDDNYILAGCSITLIGRTFEKNGSFCYLPHIDRNSIILTYDYQIDGLKFNPIYGYRILKPNFNTDQLLKTPVFRRFCEQKNDYLKANSLVAGKDNSEEMSLKLQPI